EPSGPVSRRVELLPRADRELSALPETVQNQIIAKLEMLREFPEMGPPMFDAFQDYRALLAARGSYRIVYRIASVDLVEVAYIRHCRRQTSLRPVRNRPS
ncbi:MAG: type II toxin-antitoxin system RelE family toxin, partial [Candidatus Binatia bacterium]